MARDESGEDPANVPIRYPGDEPTGCQEPVDEPLSPWYLKPGVLVLWGAVVAFLLAVVIWGIMQLVSGDSGRSGPTPSVTTTTVSPTPVTTTTTATTTTPASTAAPTTSEAPRTPAHRPAPPTTTGGIHLPHLPTQFPLPKLPTVIELPPRR